MLRTENHPEGKVRSISFHTSKGKASVGVIAPGEYEFDTKKGEQHLNVVSGEMSIKLSTDNEYKTYKAGEKFIISKDKLFRLKVPIETAYMSVYQ